MNSVRLRRMRARNSGISHKSGLPFGVEDNNNKMMKRLRPKKKDSNSKMILYVFLFILLSYYYFLRPSGTSLLKNKKAINNKTSGSDVIKSIPNESIYRLTFPNIFGEKIHLLECLGRISLVINVACN